MICTKSRYPLITLITISLTTTAFAANSEFEDTDLGVRIYDGLNSQEYIREETTITDEPLQVNRSPSVLGPATQNPIEFRSEVTEVIETQVD